MSVGVLCILHPTLRTELTVVTAGYVWRNIDLCLDLPHVALLLWLYADQTRHSLVGCSDAIVFFAIVVVSAHKSIFVLCLFPHVDTYTCFDF